MPLAHPNFTPLLSVCIPGSLRDSQHCSCSLGIPSPLVRSPLYGALMARTARHQAGRRYRLGSERERLHCHPVCRSVPNMTTVGIYMEPLHEWVSPCSGLSPSSATTRHVRLRRLGLVGRRPPHRCFVHGAHRAVFPCTMAVQYGYGTL